MKNNEELIDKLTRAYEMEEDMGGVLIELCGVKALPDEIPLAVQERIIRILESIKNDTLRHKQIVLDLKESLQNNG